MRECWCVLRPSCTIASTAPARVGCARPAPGTVGPRPACAQHGWVRARHAGSALGTRGPRPAWWGRARPAPAPRPAQVGLRLHGRVCAGVAGSRAGATTNGSCGQRRVGDKRPIPPALFHMLVSTSPLARCHACRDAVAGCVNPFAPSAARPHGLLREMLRLP